ncbi:unnamed protein product [Porites lobata]|uniref:Uncharacterized protein n=1 Tax=Porites lobata TaxID=104759 RepID=A0ABN8N8D6_9CNID|nr:unnamed protein product [Porites lobata]
MRGLEVILIIGVLVVLTYGVPVPTREDEPQLRKNQWRPGKKDDVANDEGSELQDDSEEDELHNVTLSDFSSVNDPSQAEYQLATGGKFMVRPGRRRTVSDMFSVIDPIAGASKRANFPPYNGMIRPGRKRRSHTA